MQSKPQVVFVLGGPGAGKGTVCKQLSTDEGFVHLSAGDILREEAKSESEKAAMISEYLKDYKIVPSEITVGLMKKAMEKNGWDKSKFLIDGYPRNKENLEVWNTLLGDSVETVCCLFFECSFKTLESRVLRRAETSGRADDNLEALKKRFEHFETYEKPITEEFSKLGTLVKIDSDQDLDDVYVIVNRTLKSLIK